MSLLRVVPEPGYGRERRLASGHLTPVGPLPRVLDHVPDQRVLVPELEEADLAAEVLLGAVDLEFAQMLYTYKHSRVTYAGRHLQRIKFRKVELAAGGVSIKTFFSSRLGKNRAEKLTLM